MELNFKDIINALALMLCLVISGVYVYDYPDFKKSILAFILVPFIAAMLANLEVYFQLTSPDIHYLGASGLLYALEGTDCILSVLYLRIGAKLFSRYLRSSKNVRYSLVLRRSLEVSSTIFAIVANCSLAVIALAFYAYGLSNPISFFNIVTNVGYQIHILAFFFAILGVTFFVYSTTFETNYRTLVTRLYEQT